jgi:hypothetical protein
MWRVYLHPCINPKTHFGQPKPNAFQSNANKATVPDDQGVSSGPGWSQLFLASHQTMTLAATAKITAKKIIKP